AAAERARGEGEGRGGGRGREEAGLRGAAGAGEGEQGAAVEGGGGRRRAGAGGPHEPAAGLGALGADVGEHGGELSRRPVMGGPDRAGADHGGEPEQLARGTMQIEMTIKGLMVDPITNMPIIILRDKEGQRVLPIWVGVFEANAIALQIENVTTPRPMTHDLLKNVIQDL